MPVLYIVAVGQEIYIVFSGSLSSFSVRDILPVRRLVRRLRQLDQRPLGGIDIPADRVISAAGHRAGHGRTVPVDGRAALHTEDLQGIGAVRVGIPGSRVAVISRGHPLFGDSNCLRGSISVRKGHRSGRMGKVGSSHSGSIDGAVVHGLRPVGSSGPADGKDRLPAPAAYSAYGDGPIVRDPGSKLEGITVHHITVRSAGIGPRIVHNTAGDPCGRPGQRPALHCYRT